MFSIKYLSLLFLGCAVFSACNSSKGKTKGDLDTNSKLFPSKSNPNKVAPYDLDKNGKTDLTAFTMRSTFGKYASTKVGAYGKLVSMLVTL